MATWARAALASLSDVPAVRRGGLALTEGGGRRLRFTASDRDGGRVDWCHIDAYDDVPLNTAIRSGQPVLGSLDQLAERYAGFVARQRDTGSCALAAVPLVSNGQTLGGIVLFYDQPQAFDRAQRQALTRLAAHLGADLRRAQRREQRPGVALADEPTPPGAAVAVHEVPPDPAAVSVARRFLRRTLDAWAVDADATDNALVCLSELVTNAVVHARTGCTVRVLLDKGVLTTTVRDFGSPDPASAEPLEDPLRVHGRGLQLVDALATRWGSELGAVGTTVWFVLEPGLSP